MSKRTIFLLLDAFCLILVAGYLTLNVSLVPFHGDESTTIWMSQDFHTVVLEGDFDAVGYTETDCTVDLPRCNTAQHMRIVTGNISKLAMGAAWHGAGLSVEQINDQWVWGLDPQWNQENGHVPSERLLKISRLTSAWMTALSAVFILGIARLFNRSLLPLPRSLGWLGGWLAVVLYTTHPVILLNGRRAMFEGGLLLGITATAWMIFYILKKQPGIWFYIPTGIITGLSLGTKHSAAFTVVLLYTGLLFSAALKAGQQRQFTCLLHETGKIGLATFITLLVFYVLNPLWWTNSALEMTEYVIDERQQLLEEQRNAFGGYESLSDRLDGLWQELFNPVPQYYEADFWGTYAGVNEEITTYENSHQTGIANFMPLRLTGVLITWGMFFYSVFHYRHFRIRILAVMSLWLWGLVIITLITVPLDWQRYYLPVQPALAIWTGAGFSAGLYFIQQSIRHVYQNNA